MDRQTRLDETTSYHSSHSRLSSRWFSKTSSVHDVSESIQSLVSSPTMHPSLAIASQILYPFDAFSIRHALKLTSSSSQTKYPTSLSIWQPRVSMTFVVLVSHLEIVSSLVQSSIDSVGTKASLERSYIIQEHVYISPLAHRISRT